MFSGEVSPGSYSPNKTSTSEDADREDSTTGMSFLESSNSCQEEQPPNFCLRDYVFRNRRRNLSTNWPFSQKFLELCLNHGVRNLLPPFKPSETLEALHSRPPSPPASSPKSSPKMVHSEKKKHRVSSVCPVCLSFNSPSNTAMNAHIDQCLSPELIQVKRRAKQKKMKSMAEICAMAPEWTLEDLDRRNGSNWAAELTFGTKVNGWDERKEKDGPIYVDSRGIKVLILSRLNGAKVNSSVKQSRKGILEEVKGFSFDESKVRRRKRSGLTFRSISSLAKELTLTTPESTDQIDRSQSPRNVKTGVDQPCKSSPVSSVSTISHISAEERETSSSSSFLERERSPHAHARHLSPTSNILSPPQFKRHRSPATRPTLRLMGKNLTVINPSHQSILGFPFSTEREEDPKGRTNDNRHNSYDGEKLNTDGSPYYWLPSWGGS